jgi:hypothetical protein
MQEQLFKLNETGEEWVIIPNNGELLQCLNIIPKAEISRLQLKGDSTGNNTTKQNQQASWKMEEMDSLKEKVIGQY